MSIVVDIQTVSIVVASASVVVAVIYYSFQIRHQNFQIEQQNKMKQTELVMKLYSQFTSMEFQKMYQEVRRQEAKDLRDYNEKYSWAELTAVGMFFEGIGILLKRRLIDIELVDDMFTTPIKRIWKKIENIVLEERKVTNEPEILEWFEYLYYEMKKREQRLQQSKALVRNSAGHTLPSSLTSG